MPAPKQVGYRKLMSLPQPLDSEPSYLYLYCLICYAQLVYYLFCFRLHNIGKNRGFCLNYAVIIMANKLVHDFLENLFRSAKIINILGF